MLDFINLTLQEFIRKFNCEDVCLSYLEERFWNNVPVSPFDHPQKCITMAIISTDVERQAKTLMSRQILCSTERKYHLTNGFMLFGRLLIALMEYPQYN